MSFGNEEVTGPTIDTNWHHITITSTSTVSASNMDIGRIGSSYFEGSIDEVHLSSLYASSSPTKTTYNNQSDVSNFLSFNTASSVTSYFESTLVVTIPDNHPGYTGYKWQVMACDDDGDCTEWDQYDTPASGINFS